MESQIFFKNHFSRPSTKLLNFNWERSAFDKTWDYSSLISSFFGEEIITAVFDMEGDRAMGLDGFPVLFFQRYWENFKGDLCRFLFTFFDGRVQLHCVNYSWFVLILNKVQAETINDF